MFKIFSNSDTKAIDYKNPNVRLLLLLMSLMLSAKTDTLSLFFINSFSYFLLSLLNWESLSAPLCQRQWDIRRCVRDYPVTLGPPSPNTFCDLHVICQSHQCRDSFQPLCSLAGSVPFSFITFPHFSPFRAFCLFGSNTSGTERR